jgi:hypothetical protein
VLQNDEINANLDENEIALAKFERTYKTKFVINKNIAIKELEMLLEIPEMVSIPVKNIALEI